MQAINIKLFRKYPRKRADKGGRNKSMPQGSSGSSEYNYPTKHTIKIKWRNYEIELNVTLISINIQ